MSQHMLILSLLLILSMCSSATGNSAPGLPLSINGISGGSSSGSSVPSPTPHPIKVCYQGEPGAYSEKSLRELLGPSPISVARKSFEDCFKAVSSREADYAILPVENSLGGSIHENYDLMLRYDLSIIAEHDFRVKHCFLMHKDAKESDIKFAISHPQALAQCQNYLRARNITPIGTYDTAGSAKMIALNAGLPEGCTIHNTVAIASDLAGKTYGLQCPHEAIEDDDSNFTRFLLLSRTGVSHLLSKKIPSKTSIVFTLPESAGALYKALACFSLRDVDFSKIESRPTSASLLQYLRFKSTTASSQTLPHFRYCFYLDFLDHELSQAAQHSLNHLQEQAQFVRVLGSYPRTSRLIGAVKSQIDGLKSDGGAVTALDSDKASTTLKIGLVGYGKKARRLAMELAKQQHEVSVLEVPSAKERAEGDGFKAFSSYDSGAFLAQKGLDVVVISAPLIAFEEAVSALPSELLRNKLVVSLNPLLEHCKDTMLNLLPAEADVLCANAMLDNGGDINGAPFVYEKVRVKNLLRSEKLVQAFQDARMRPVELDAASHDKFTGGSQFITSLMGRILNKQKLRPSPVNTRGYEVRICTSTV